MSLHLVAKRLLPRQDPPRGRAHRAVIEIGALGIEQPVLQRGSAECRHPVTVSRAPAGPRSISELVRKRPAPHLDRLSRLGDLRYRLRMRHFARVFSFLLIASVATVSGQSRAARTAPPCTTATASCTEWVALDGGPARSLIYRTRSLDVRDENVRRALIMVHGTNRNADHYFSTAVSAAFLAGALDDSVVISPRIASAAGSCHDALAPNEVSWSCTGDSWRSGGSAASHPDLTSFDFIDQILKKLANRSVFPNLHAIVVAGHSAGGQFVARYQMSNRVHDTLGVPVTYVVANPSSYAWPDGTRPRSIDDAAPERAKAAWETEKVHTNFSYGPFEASACPNYDRWPAGLEQRTSGYTAGTSDD